MTEMYLPCHMVNLPHLNYDLYLELCQAALMSIWRQHGPEKDQRSDAFVGWFPGITVLSFLICEWWKWLRGRSVLDPTPSTDRRVKRASGRITWTILENWTKGIRILSRILLLNKALTTGICSYTILLSWGNASGEDQCLTRRRRSTASGRRVG